VKRVPETVPEEIARKSHFKLEQPAPVATIDELKSYDAIIVGIPTRFGRMSAQMTNFWDQGGGLWASSALVGKVGSVMSSSATQHGGQHDRRQPGSAPAERKRIECRAFSGRARRPNHGRAGRRPGRDKFVTEPSAHS
jgi:multimeric flavodoxin WrbA